MAVRPPTPSSALRCVSDSHDSATCSLRLRQPASPTRRRSSGVITTVAGNGSAGFGGDQGPSHTRGPESSWGVAWHWGICHCRQTYCVIRRVDGNGIITTVVGVAKQLRLSVGMVGWQTARY